MIAVSVKPCIVRYRPPRSSCHKSALENENYENSKTDLEKLEAKLQKKVIIIFYIEEKDTSFHQR